MTFQVSSDIEREKAKGEENDGESKLKKIDYRIARKSL
jgi:hypothetical protein